MTIYRITTEKWSKSLAASDYSARWNAKGQFVIYTAESRSLACLENVVHRSGEGNDALYKVMLIDIPDNLSIEIVDEQVLKRGWHTMENYAYCQLLGRKWLTEAVSAILKVPSVVIKMEHNYLINSNHPDFSKIILSGIEDFNFDKRF